MASFFLCHCLRNPLMNVFVIFFKGFFVYSSHVWHILLQLFLHKFYLNLFRIIKIPFKRSQKNLEISRGVSKRISTGISKRTPGRVWRKIPVTISGEIFGKTFMRNPMKGNPWSNFCMKFRKIFQRKPKFMKNSKLVEEFQAEFLKEPLK